MSETNQILEALAKAEKPFGSKDLVEATGLDKKIISKHITALKKQGFVDNPVRCKYGITEEGKTSLK
jgi:predicted transcriptional regulator